MHFHPTVKAFLFHSWRPGSWNQPLSMNGLCFDESAFPIIKLCIWNSLAIPSQTSDGNIWSPEGGMPAQVSHLPIFPPARTIRQQHWTKSVQQTQPTAAVIYCHFFLFSQIKANPFEQWKHWRFRNNCYEVMPGNTLTGQDSSLEYLPKQQSHADNTMA